jgi:hypothetical protein
MFVAGEGTNRTGYKSILSVLPLVAVGDCMDFLGLVMSESVSTRDLFLVMADNCTPLSNHHTPISVARLI